VMVSELSAADADWLQGIQSGISLGEATAATLERHPGFDLLGAMQQLIAQGVLSDFNLRTMP